VAYSFYTVPGQFTMTELMKDALILARNKGYDVFNALDIT
jgi:glycylpeptide N-tetradecanoyltransferase